MICNVQLMQGVTQNPRWQNACPSHTHDRDHDHTHELDHGDNHDNDVAQSTTMYCITTLAKACRLPA